MDEYQVNPMFDATRNEQLVEENEALRRENERLREVLEKVLVADNDPNDKLTYIRSRLLAEIEAALRQET